MVQKGGPGVTSGEVVIPASKQIIVSVDNAASIDWSQGDAAAITLDEWTELTFTPPAGPCEVFLEITQGSTPQEIRWPSSCRWASGNKPTLTQVAGAIDVINLWYDGTNYNNGVAYLKVQPRGTFKFQIVTSAPNETFTLPISHWAFILDDFHVTWGDGQSGDVLKNNDSARMHTYVDAGTYEIEMNGTCQSFNFDVEAGSDNGKITKLLEFTGDMGFMSLNFNNCPNLDSICPLGSFKSLYKDGGGYGIESLFKDCVSLTTIPAGMFDAIGSNYNSFTDTFNGCTGITAIPADLFKYNTATTAFVNTFYGCTGLVNVLDGTMFENQTAVTNFDNVFYGCSGLTGAGWGSGAVPETVPDTIIYNAENQIVPPASTVGCFTGCYGLTDHGLIPEAWGGDTTAPDAPTVDSDAETLDTTPTWTWNTPEGVVLFRYSYDEATWTETEATEFTPSSPLSVGAHTLYVQGSDLSHNWSASGSFEVTIMEIELPSEANVVAAYFMNDNAATTDIVAAFGTNGVATFNTENNTVVGKINNALNFNGTTDGIEIGANVNIPIDDAARSLEVWANADVLTGEQFIAGQGTLDAESSRFSLLLVGDALWFVYNDTYVVTGYTVTTGWHHYVLTYGSGGWKLYVDGELVDSDVITSLSGSATTMCIGKATWSDSAYFDGKVDVTRFYNVALNLGNAVALYNSGAGIEDLTP